MNSKTKAITMTVLCVVIIGALGLSAYTLSRGRPSGPNPNVTLVPAPDQVDFEEHPEWVLPEPEVIDYGENLALGKEVNMVNFHRLCGVFVSCCAKP